MLRPAVGVPAGRVGAAEAVHQLLGQRQRQLVAGDLDVEQHDVHAVEEIQVDVHHLQRHRRVAGARLHAHRGDVVAAEDAHRRALAVLVVAAARAALAVEEALHVGQEGDELVVVALVELCRVAGELVELLAAGDKVVGAF